MERHNRADDDNQGEASWRNTAAILLSSVLTRPTQDCGLCRRRRMSPVSCHRPRQRPLPHQSGILTSLSKLLKFQNIQHREQDSAYRRIPTLMEVSIIPVIYRLLVRSQEIINLVHHVPLFRAILQQGWIYLRPPRKSSLINEFTERRRSMSHNGVNQDVPCDDRHTFLIKIWHLIHPICRVESGTRSLRNPYEAIHTDSSAHAQYVMATSLYHTIIRDSSKSFMADSLFVEIRRIIVVATHHSDVVVRL